MELNKTLKTYDDGSEMTVALAAATVGIGLLAASAGAAVVIAKAKWSERRIMKKYRMGPYINK